MKTTVGERTGAQKVLGRTAFYRMRFHRAVGRLCELAADSMNVWWSESDRLEVPENLSLSLSLRPPLSRRPILPAITSLVDQIKGPGGAAVRPGGWIKWLTGYGGRGRAGPWFVFHEGGPPAGVQVCRSHVPWNSCEFNSRTRDSTPVERARSNSPIDRRVVLETCIFRRELKRFAARAALRCCLPWPSFRVIFFIRCTLGMIEGNRYPGVSPSMTAPFHRNYILIAGECSPV